MYLNSQKSALANKILVSLLGAMFCGSLLANEPLAERKLETIKHRLVDLALKTNVRLGSSAYLDGDGVLHESSVMSSDADIRGVRVLSYLEEAGIDTALVDAKIFSSSECPGSKPNIQRQVLVKRVMDNSFSGKDFRAGDHYISELLLYSQESLLDIMDTSDDWASSAQVHYTSTYDRYVASRAIDNANYRFEITIRERTGSNLLGSGLAKTGQVLQGAYHMASKKGQELLSRGFNGTYEFLAWGNPHLPDVDIEGSWDKQLLEYQLTLINRATETPVWRKSRSLYYPRVKQGYKKDILPRSVKRQLVSINQQLLANVTKSIDCRTEHYPLNVISGRDDKYKIYAGSLAGVRVGDQFLISTNNKILTQSLSMSGLAELGLAQVESMSRQTSVLKHIAGPKPKGLGGISNSVAMQF
jgi:hypothetical protein